MFSGRKLKDIRKKLCIEHLTVKRPSNGAKARECQKNKLQKKEKKKLSKKKKERKKERKKKKKKTSRK